MGDDFGKKENIGKMDKVKKRTESIISSNVQWLLNSGIRIKKSDDKGALYGWKYLNPPSYPFIYSEITGYAVSCYCWICSELGRPEALHTAKEAAQWIIRNMNSEFLLVTGYRKQDSFVQKGDLSNQIYLFDNAMAMIGLLNLYKISGKKDLLRFARNMADSMIRHFFDRSTISTALLDRFYKPVESKKGKWSAVPGSYHSKLSLGFLDLSKFIDDTSYASISNSICDFAVSLQKADGRFETSPDSQITFLHPHLYSCEGLIYSGLYQSNLEHLRSGLEGIVWAARHINEMGGLPRDNSNQSLEQSDAMSQLLRLLILCYSELTKYIDESYLADMIKRLHARLIDFCMMDDNDDRGAVKYQLGLDTACSWCTMFCMQALWLRQKKTIGLLEDINAKKMDFFV
jgi:hypothetical protein